MKTFDIIYLAALNLYRRLGRTLLTVVGVIIGTASIVIMIAIGLTNLAQFDKILKGTEITRIEVQENTTESPEVLTRGGPVLNDISLTALREIEGVKRVVPLNNLQMYGQADRFHTDYLNIVTAPAENLPDLAKLAKGRYPSENSSMPEVIMGMGVARQFIQGEEDYSNRDYKGPSIDWLDTTINMYLGGKEELNNPEMPSSRQYRVRVVGIIEDIDGETPSYDIYMDINKGKAILKENYKLARELGIGENSYDMVYVYGDRIENVKDILKTIENYGFQGYSDTQWIDEIQKQERAQQGQLAVIGFISLIVSAIGIANTMMTGVLERRREIGVMKVVGVATRKIRYMFLAEAAIIGLIGGLAGILLSHLFGYIISTGSGETIFLGMYFSGGVKMIIPLWLDMAAMGLAITVGIIAGILPSSKATKMSPLEAIRG